MKKVLLATTLLVAASAAHAEVALSGSARMGIVNDGTDTFFSSRARVKFSLSGETDGGLSFGGSFRADNASGANSGTAGSVFVSGAFGKLEMGDVTGAAEAVVGDLPEMGYTDVANNDVTFLAGDGFNGTAPAALYTYSAGDLTLALGASDGVGGVNGIFVALGNSAANSAADVQELSVGAKYAMGDYSVSLGYESADYTDLPTGSALPSFRATHLIVSGNAKVAGADIMAFYGKGGDALDGFRQYGLGVSYTADALTVSAMAKREDFFGDVTYYGIGAAYDLGGGAKVIGGYGDDNVGSAATYDLGMTFSF